MNSRRARSGAFNGQDGPFHYAFVVAAVTFVCMLGAAGLRSAPGVLLVPLQLAFPWDRATVSVGAGIGLLVNGLIAPFAASLMQRFGIKRVLLGSLALMAIATTASLFMTAPWEYFLTWGILSGMGSGAVGGVLAASVVSRWFARHQGLVMGILSASTATGSLIFLPVMAELTSRGAWKPVAQLIAISMACLIPIAWALMRERPETIGLRRFGEDRAAAAAPSPTPQRLSAVHELGSGLRNSTFWLLLTGFFVCGFTSNGIVGTHLIAFCGDHGIAPDLAARSLALMGVLDIIGITASGWLTDRYDARRLLVLYFAVRGLSLLMLPYIDLEGSGMILFSVLFGLNWLATVPPTLMILKARFGETRAPILYGWLFTGHQAGAAAAAYGGGLIRELSGSYASAFTLSGLLALIVSGLFLVAAGRFARKPVSAQFAGSMLGE